MFNVNIILYCFCLSLNNFCILSTDSDSVILPKYQIPEDISLSIEDVLYNLVSEYIHISPKCIKYHNFDIIKNGSDIDICYVSILPIDTKVVNVFRIPYNMSSDPLIHKAIRYV